MSARRGAQHDFSEHEEVWLHLPFVASGRLPEALRVPVERHLAGCDSCCAELAQQRELCAALLLPERITHVPRPSLAKLLARLDAAAAWEARRPQMSARGAHQLWRPPGFGWAVSLLLVSAAAGGWVSRGMPLPDPARLEAALRTHTGLVLPQLGMAAHPAVVAVVSRTPAVHEDPPQPTVLYISFAGKISVTEVVSRLRAMGAQVVAQPGDTGTFGVILDDAGPQAMQRLKDLATQLRGDPRVRWVEPAAQ